MADKKDMGVGEAVNRVKDLIAREVEQHKDEEVNLEELEDVSGGWTISTYHTDPSSTDPTIGPATGNQT
jgi:hypothetical protein